MYWQVEHVVAQHALAGETTYYQVDAHYANNFDPVPDRLDFTIATSAGYNQSCYITNQPIPVSTC
jgi:hypothetical protein